MRRLLIVSGIVVWLVTMVACTSPLPTPTDTPTAEPTPTPTTNLEPTATPLSAPTFTPMPTSTPTPEEVCIPSGDHSSIQAALTEPGAKAILCPNAVFELGQTIVFTHDNQEIYTQGFPRDDSRALLTIVSKSSSRLSIPANLSRMAASTWRLCCSMDGWCGGLLTPGIPRNPATARGKEVHHPSAMTTSIGCHHPFFAQR